MWPLVLLVLLAISTPALADEPLPWVQEHYDAVSLHATSAAQGGHYVAFWRGGKVRALRWRLDDMQWQAGPDGFRLEWRDADCCRVVEARRSVMGRFMAHHGPSPALTCRGEIASESK